MINALILPEKPHAALITLEYLLIDVTLLMFAPVSLGQELLTTELTAVVFIAIMNFQMLDDTAFVFKGFGARWIRTFVWWTFLFEIFWNVILFLDLARGRRIWDVLVAMSESALDVCVQIGTCMTLHVIIFTMTYLRIGLDFFMRILLHEFFHRVMMR